jgi:hypothetical protein
MSVGILSVVDNDSTTRPNQFDYRRHLQVLIAGMDELLVEGD